MPSPGASKQYRMERERREREALEQSERTRLKRGAAKYAMAFWNAALAAGWRTIFYPSVGTALATGCHWLHVVCPACQQMGMSCKRCSPHPPFARPLGATRRSWEGKEWRRKPR